MPDPTLPIHVREVARRRRLYSIDRADGRIDLVEATVDVPVTTGDLRPLGVVIAGRLDGVYAVATNTPGVFLVVPDDDLSDEVEQIADAALRADAAPTAPDLPIEPGDSADPVGALAVAHVADLRVRVEHLSAVVSLLPASRRRAAARAAVADLDRALDAVVSALDLDAGDPCVDEAGR